VGLPRARAVVVGRDVTHAVLSRRIRLGDADINLLRELLAADIQDGMRVGQQCRQPPVVRATAVTSTPRAIEAPGSG
jgi:hypothetical protein